MRGNHLAYAATQGIIRGGSGNTRDEGDMVRFEHDTVRFGQHVARVIMLGSDSTRHRDDTVGFGQHT